MSIAKGVVQAPTNISFSDGDDTSIILGKQGEQLMAPLHSEYYTQAYRGCIFHASTTPLGLAIPIYTSTAPVVCLWNPIGSGKNLSIVNIVFAYASGTAAYASVGLSYVAGAGSSIATGAVFSAFGTSNVINGLVGGGSASVAKVATAGTTTLTTAPTAANFFYTLGSINLEAQTGTAHATFVPGAGSNPKGSLLIVPGSAVWLCASIASSALYATTISWSEAPT
jgi:hypothetical protein